MHILYADESGTVGDPDLDHFVLAGLAVFERGIYHLIKAVDDLVASWQLAPDPQDVEIHASPMYQGRKGTVWQSLERGRRVEMMLEALELLRGHSSIRAFGVAVHKAAVTPDHPLLYAYEEISNRFDKFLSRMYSRGYERQRGLMLMDASQYGGFCNDWPGTYATTAPGGTASAICRKCLTRSIRNHRASSNWLTWLLTLCCVNMRGRTNAFSSPSPRFLMPKAG